MRSGREQSLLARHPWLFSGSILGVFGDPGDGDEVAVRTSSGDFIAWGLYNSHSQIRVRLYSWREQEHLDSAFWRRRLERAIALRAPWGRAAVRLVHSEGDGLSGLVVDRFEGWAILQLTSLALARRVDLLLDLLDDLLAPRGIYLRTERGILHAEGLELRGGLLRGQPPSGSLEIVEEGLRFLVDVEAGQKTGFYLDQRMNRVRASAYAQGREVADVCCYSGGFALHALRAGAVRTVGVDVSAAGLELAARNAELNDLSDRASWVRADAFRWLTERKGQGERFGMVVLDPPRFAQSRRGISQALRGYQMLNDLAVGCLEPGGILVTCSCSGRVSREEFTAMVGRVVQRSRRDVQILESLGQAPDHPVSASCPESSYLKCLICRVD